jgi:putative ABC transport system ATP-binding protein
MSNSIENIHLEHVIPNAMRDMRFSASSIWSSATDLPKENTLIIAPSGTGKTSLLGFIYGLRNDFSGEIHLGSTNISNQKLSWWTNKRQQNLSVIFQDLRLIPHLTVGENLILKNNLTNFKSIEEIKKMASFLGIEEKWNQTCGTLSFGQQQRVCIIRSLLQPMDFLLADEPFSHIDDENITKARTLILDECKMQGSAIILFSLGHHYEFNFAKTLSL